MKDLIEKRKEKLKHKEYLIGDPQSIMNEIYDILDDLEKRISNLEK